MAYIKNQDATEFKELARKMYFSNETVASFLGYATAGQVAAVSRLIEDELETRDRRKRERLLRKARFPQMKSLDAFDFSQVSLPDGYGIDELESLSFIEAAQDFVFHGKTGRGKTHLAIALGMACVARGMQARFFTAASLVLMLVKANREHQLETMLKDIRKCDLVIIDELGYVPLDQEGSRLLFQVMSDCYESRSMIITTNIEFSKWGVVFGDEKLASALIDRLMHHGRLVEFNGTSKRMENALMLGKAPGITKKSML